MVDTVTREMSALLGLADRPVMKRVFRWPGGTPQLEVGHLARMEAVEGALAAKAPGVHLAGAGIRSTGIPDSVAEGARAARAAAETRCEPPALRAPLAAARARRAALPPRRRPDRRTPTAAEPAAPGGGAAARRALPEHRGALTAAPGGHNHVADSVVYVQVYRSPYDWALPWRQEPVSGASGSGFLIDGRAHPDQRPRRRRRAADPGAPARPGQPLRRHGGHRGRRLRPRGAARRRPRVPRRPAAAAARRPCRRPAPASSPTASRWAARTSPRPRASSRASSRAATCTPVPTRTSSCRPTPPSTPGNSGGPVVQDGRVVGVAFQGFPGVENMGFFIPDADRPPLPREPEGRPLRRLPGLGARDDAARLARVPQRARPAARAQRSRGGPHGPGRDVRRGAAPGRRAARDRGHADRQRRHDPRRRLARDVRARGRHDAGRPARSP